MNAGPADHEASARRSDGGPVARTVGLTRRYASGRRAGGGSAELPGSSRSAAHVVTAVENVDLEVPAGLTTALVGESGSGKSTLARLLVALERPDAGRVEYRGRDLATFGASALREFRRSVQIVFQDPHGSLNPRQTCGSALREVLKVHRIARGEEADRHGRALIERVGLDVGTLARHPHELSGGERQRVAIARALSVEPEFVVLDEPVSALDVSVQAQILDLLRDLQRVLGLTYLFVSHDLAVVRNIADRVAVMRAGRIVERGDVERVLGTPEHEYTRELLAAVPRIP